MFRNIFPRIILFLPWYTSEDECQSNRTISQFIIFILKLTEFIERANISATFWSLSFINNVCIFDSNALCMCSSSDACICKIYSIWVLFDWACVKASLALTSTECQICFKLPVIFFDAFPKVFKWNIGLFYRLFSFRKFKIW